MDLIWNLYQLLIDTKGFPQRWYCGTAWTPELGWTHIIADLIIFISYISIPIGIFILSRKRRFTRYKLVIWMFILFIILCGITHLIEASIFWHPWYRLSAFLKILTAIISLTTAIYLLIKAPKLLKLTDDLKQKYYLQEIIKNMPYPLLIINKQLNIIFTNENFTRYTNFKHPDLKSNFIRTLIHKEYTDLFSKTIEDCFHFNRNTTKTLKIVSKNSKVTNVEMTFIYLDIDNEPEVLVSIQDIQKDIMLQQVNIKLKSIFNGVEDAIFLTEDNGRIYSANKKAISMFGFSEDELIIMNFDDLLAQPFTKEYITESFSQKSNKTTIKKLEKNFTGVTKNGQKIILEIYGGKLKIKNERTYTIIIKDVTEKIKMENKIKSAYSELENFSYIAAHDLREPLRGISNYCNFLKEDYYDIIDDDGQKMLKTLQKLCKRLENLIESILHYSLLDKTEDKYKKVDLNKEVKDVLNSIKITIKQKNCKIIFKNDLPTIECQPIKIREVFHNLISNALKYNNKDDIIIEIGVIKEAKETSDSFIFYVKDNGIGIKKEHKKIIFKMFKRLHARDEYNGGSGAGLSFVKKIIEQHNGKIWLESEPNKGTIFYFKIGAK